MSQRYVIQVAITLSVGDAETIHASNTLSRYSAQFVRTVPYPAGTEVDVSFVLPADDAVIGCRGEVMTIAEHPGSMAVRFINIADEDARRIARFAASVLTKSGRHKGY